MIQVYTGDGKGKTTAAFGLALRAAGAGLRVFICQFTKGRDCSELKALKKIKNIKIEQFGSGCFIKKKPNKNDIRFAQEGFKKIETTISRNLFDIIILDEINIAMDLNLITTREILRLISNCPTTVELVLTGRKAKPCIIKAADLVSEIKEIKHYYKKGIKARRGIEY